MHRLDPKLQKMDAHLESVSDDEKPSLEKEIKALRRLIADWMPWHVETCQDRVVVFFLFFWGGDVIILSQLACYSHG